MRTLPFSHEQLVRIAKLTPEDIEEVSRCRRAHNRLGFAYQLAFVKLTNRFPVQQPFEINEELLRYVSVQTGLSALLIRIYIKRQPTLSEHQEQIRTYLQLRRLGEAGLVRLKQFLLDESGRLVQTGPLLVQAKQFLKEEGTLCPADDTLQRLIVKQRQLARQHIFERITNNLTHDLLEKLDGLLVAGETRLTLFQSLKQPPGKPSPVAMLRLVSKLEQIQETGILMVDLSWLNNNYQRSLARYTKQCSADRIRRLRPEHGYAALVCFLWQVHRDTIDYMIDMHDKLITRMYSRAQADIDEQTRKQRRMIQTSLYTLRILSKTILDEAIDDSELRQVLFSRVGRDRLVTQMASVETWLTGKYSHVFNMITQRFSYLRQFAPALLQRLEFQLESGVQSTLVEAVQLLRELNEANKRKLPDDAPLDFIPRRLRPLVVENDKVSKRAWECALLTAVRDEIRAGNVYVQQSKRFGRFDDFFISNTRWHSSREGFFQRAGLPVEAKEVPAYLTERLNLAYDQFLESLPENAYASVDEDGWRLSTDQAEKLDTDSEQRLDELNEWLSDNLRNIKLPELLIEVDNELQFTSHFTLPTQHNNREAEHVCMVLATIMAHGCNIGPYTMAQLTDGITYRQIKHVTDWQLTEEAQRQALAQLVNAISNLDVT